MKTQARVRRMSAERPNISALTVMRRGCDQRYSNRRYDSALRHAAAIANGQSAAAASV